MMTILTYSDLFGQSNHKNCHHTLINNCQLIPQLKTFNDLPRYSLTYPDPNDLPSYILRLILTPMTYTDTSWPILTHYDLYESWPVLTFLILLRWIFWLVSKCWMSVGWEYNHQYRTNTSRTCRHPNKHF